MQLPGPASLLFLSYLLVVIPLGAIRSRRILRPPAGSAPSRPIPSRRQILGQTIFVLIGLGLLAWYAGRQFDYDPFAIPAVIRPEDWLAGMVALAAATAIVIVSRRFRTEEERRNPAIDRWMPQDGPERALFVVTAVLAGLAEEAAYRGVLVEVLNYSLGSWWVAVAVSAIAFGVAHAVQGWKSGIAIVAIALLMQGLVAVTGTLVVAMAVHAVYDIVAGLAAGRAARRRALEAGGPAPR